MSELKPHAETKAMSEGSGTAGGYLTKPEDEETPADEPDMDADDVEDETDEAGGFRAGDHVHFRGHKSHGGVKGVGVVERIHKNGFVGDTENDMMATPEEPAARVKCWRKMADGHVPTGTKLGVKLKCLSKMDAPMKAPTKMKSAEPTPTPASKTTTKAPAITVDPLPPLVALSEEQMQARIIKSLEEQKREAAKAAVAEVQRLYGVV